jgi:hypothetical protein
MSNHFSPAVARLASIVLEGNYNPKHDLEDYVERSYQSVICDLHFVID